MYALRVLRVHIAHAPDEELSVVIIITVITEADIKINQRTWFGRPHRSGDR